MEGVTYVDNGGPEQSDLRELNDFINRCLTEIKNSPESMNAGLSSQLLKQIVVASADLQYKVIKDVYLNILAELCSGKAKMINKVAYLTVLIGLTEAIMNNDIWRPFAE
jgi:hypothetical protein